VIVSCPACATRFSLDASLLGPNGRNVRCAKCGHRWRQEPPAPVVEMPDLELAEAGAAGRGAVAEPVVERNPLEAPGLTALLSGQNTAPAQPASTPRVVVPPKLRPATPARRVGVWPWFLLAGIVVGLAAAGYIFRDEVSRAVPAAQDLYAMLGLGDNDPAKLLQIGNLKTEKRENILSVRGDIFNPTELPLKLPALNLLLGDANGAAAGQPLAFRTQETEIAPGETITFRVAYPNPPDTVRKVSVVWLRVIPKEP